MIQAAVVEVNHKNRMMTNKALKVKTFQTSYSTNREKSFWLM